NLGRTSQGADPFGKGDAAGAALTSRRQPSVRARVRFRVSSREGEDTVPQAHDNTTAVHAGQGPDPGTGAILTPIFQSTTSVQQPVGVHKGHTYSRASNPTVSVLEPVWANW